METTSYHLPPLLATVPDGAHLSPHTAGRPTPGCSGGLLAASRCYPAPSPSPTSPHSEPRGPAGEEGCSHPNCQTEQMGPGQTDGMQPCLCGCRTCSSHRRFSKFWDFMASAASGPHWPPDRQHPIDTGQGVKEQTATKQGPRPPRPHTCFGRWGLQVSRWLRVGSTDRGRCWCRATPARLHTDTCSFPPEHTVSQRPGVHREHNTPQGACVQHGGMDGKQSIDGKTENQHT